MDLSMINYGFTKVKAYWFKQWNLDQWLQIMTLSKHTTKDTQERQHTINLNAQFMRSKEQVMTF